MRLGIVGSEAAKFTPDTERTAREQIRIMAEMTHATVIISGHSPLGGIDIWAEEYAQAAGLPCIVHAPKLPATWSSPGGYKERNLAIARDSDLVYCITLKVLPDHYKGMRFRGCYHCKGRNPEHVKSGGCWTAWKCERRAWTFI